VKEDIVTDPLAFPTPKNFSSYYAPRDYLQWDLQRGVLRSRGGARVIAFPQEFSQGLLEGLLDECGEAWPVVLYRCGEWWGRRQMERMSKDLEEHLGGALSGFPTGLAQTILSDAWACHGWGRLELELKDIERGLLHATVEGAPFAALFVSQQRDAKGRPVDALLAGSLAGMFSQASGADMAAHEIACVARGEPSCRFVIGLQDRLKGVPDLLRRKIAPDEILAQLRGGAR
jgi:predicted hydrocarbon binding protein